MKFTISCLKIHQVGKNKRKKHTKDQDQLHKQIIGVFIKDHSHSLRHIYFVNTISSASDLILHMAGFYLAGRIEIARKSHGRVLV